MQNEEYYQKVRQKFIDYKNTYIGPICLTYKLVAGIGINIEKNKLEMERYNDNNIWRKLVEEFCPYQAMIPNKFNIEHEIDSVDGNTNYIYASGYNVLDTAQRFLQISDQSILVSLKLGNLI